MLTRVLNYLMLLALVVWLGGIIFFAAVMAPTVFRVLPSTDLAGNVIAPSLKALHRMGLVAGMIFLAASLLLPTHLPKTTFMKLAPAFVLLMLLLTGIAQFYVIPRMEELRPAMAGYTYIIALPDSGKRAEEARQKFDSLHHWSTRLEGAVLILGLVVLGYFVMGKSDTP